LCDAAQRHVQVPGERCCSSASAIKPGSEVHVCEFSDRATAGQAVAQPWMLILR
jgi:hypothetical protein